MAGLTLAPALLALLALAQQLPVSWAVDIDVPFYPTLPTIPAVNLGAPYGGYGKWTEWPYEVKTFPMAPPLRINMVAEDLVINDTSAGTFIRLSSPVYEGQGINDPLLVAPIALLDSAVPFQMVLGDQLPFLPLLGCGAGRNLSDIINGARDETWTNLHTHGLRVDPGAVDATDLCAQQALAVGVPERGYYCGEPPIPDVGTQTCVVLGDNIFVTARPGLPPVLPVPGFNNLVQYTYPLPRVTPGIFWYHPHFHGSVGYQTQTSHGPFIVRESSIPGGLKGLYDPLPGTTNKRGRCIAKCIKKCKVPYGAPKDKRERSKAQYCVQDCVNACPGDCATLRQILARQPNTKASLLVFSGIFTRFNNDPTFCAGAGAPAPCPDDDTILFLACNAQPRSPLSCGGPEDPNNFYAGITAQLQTPRDYVLINGAMQPSIPALPVGRYTRLQLLNTLVMKWMDVAVWRMPTTTNADGELQFNEPAPCSLLLLAKDGVPLPLVPRLLASRGPLLPQGVNSISDVLLVPASRADVLLRCEEPGDYMLVSGAGPYDTQPACNATHCELFGRRPASPGAPERYSGNNFYRGQLYSAAVLATIHVPPPEKKYPYSSGYGKKDGDYKPDGKKDGDYKPDGKKDGDYKPDGKKDGDYKPDGKKDGEYKPDGKKDGEYKPDGKKDGEYKPQYDDPSVDAYGDKGKDKYDTPDGYGKDGYADGKDGGTAWQLWDDDEKGVDGKDRGYGKDKGKDKKGKQYNKGNDYGKGQDGYEPAYQYDPKDAWLWDYVFDMADPILTGEVCSSRLSQFPYLDTANFPPIPVQHCYTLNNQDGGAACNINGCLFGTYEACIDQGTTQDWRLRDITFHPFHLHETPIEALRLPPCLFTPGRDTDYYKVGDWQDVWQFPTCECQETNTSSIIRRCDEGLFRFLGSQFTANSTVSPITSQVMDPVAAGTCQERLSVFHCHILQHEDEGCMAFARWACPAGPGLLSCPADQIGTCPDAEQPITCTPNI